MPEASALAVRKSIKVDAPPDVAFEVFTAGIATWWPLKTHSVNQSKTAAVTMEARLRGRLYETDDSGNEQEWGVLTAWEPPTRVAFTWHPGYDDATQHTDVAVTFTPDGSGTRVTLVHTNWERLGGRAAEAARSYDTGWDYVLGQYIEGANGRDR